MELRIEWSHPEKVSKPEGRWRSQVKMWESEYTKRYREFPEMLSEEFKEFVEENKRLIDDNKRSFCLITINFEPEQEIGERLLNKVEKALDKKWIHDFVMNWEFVNEDGNWSHPHIHIFCTKSGMAKSGIIREFHSTFKDYIKKECIDVQVYSKKDKLNGINYVKKNRIDDLWWREKFDLPSNISKNNKGKILKEGKDWDYE